MTESDYRRRGDRAPAMRDWNLKNWSATSLRILWRACHSHGPFLRVCGLERFQHVLPIDIFNLLRLPTFSVRKTNPDPTKSQPQKFGTHSYGSFKFPLEFVKSEFAWERRKRLFSPLNPPCEVQHSGPLEATRPQAGFFLTTPLGGGRGVRP